MAVQPIVAALHPPSLTDVVSLAPVAVAAFDRTLTCTAANLRFLDLVGRGEHQVEGLKLGALVPELTQRDLRVVARILDGTTPEALIVVRIGTGAQQEQWRLQLYPVVRDDVTTGIGLVAEEVRDGSGHTRDQDEDALEPWDPILDRACGLLMGRDGCTEAQALLELARLARQRRRTLEQVAAELYAGNDRRAAVNAG